MTKLSFLVTSTFIFLAVAMWYLANASFEEYVQERISKIGHEATGLNVKVGKVRQLNNELVIENITFYNNEVTPTLVLSNIQLSINEESVKEDAMIINSLIIEHVIKHYENESKKTTLFNHLQAYKTDHLLLEKESIQSMFLLKSILINTSNHINMNTQDKAKSMDKKGEEIALSSSIMNTPKGADALFVEVLARLIK